MRTRIVLRSLGVILAAPFVALPFGQAPESVERAPSAPEPAAETVEKRPVQTGAFAHFGIAKAAAAEPLAPAAEAPREISVACGRDGCVVQNGLELMVVAGRPAR